MSAPRVAGWRLRRPRLFYGWYIVGVAVLAQFISSGTQAYASGVFLKPMTDSLHWSRESFSAVQTFSTVVMGTLGLFIGSVIDRRGPRLLMAVGAIIAGVALCATSLVQEVWQFYLVRGVAATVGTAMLGNLVVNVTVAKWFVVRRGLAIALAALGVSLGGVVMAPVLSLFIDSYGWRPAWVLLGVTVWVLMLPAALVIRAAPERYGLLPDGMSVEAARAYSALRHRASAVSEVQWTRSEAVRTRAMWLVMCAFGIAGVGFGALLLHLIPFLSDQGYPRARAALLFSSFTWAAFLSKPVWGALLIDRFHARYLAALGFTISASAMLGLLVAAHAHSTLAIVIALVAYGCGTGGVVPLQETVWASYFGRTHLGSIRGVAMPFTIVFGAGGPLLAGGLYDRTGNYTAAFTIFAAFQLVGVVLMILARPPRRRATMTEGAVAVPAGAPEVLVERSSVG